jgi:transposase
MKAYPMELRERVMRDVEEGDQTRQEIADTFRVTTRWIRKLVERYRQTDSIAPLPHAGGREEKFTPERLERLKALVDKKPTATLKELRKASRVPCCIMTVARAVQQLGYTRKKRRYVRVSKIVPK